MARKVIVNDPNAGPDATFEVPLLGLFQNGVETEVSDEQITAYEQVYGTLPQSGTIEFPEINQKAAEDFDADERAKRRETVRATEVRARMEAANSEVLTATSKTSEKTATTSTIKKEGGESS